MTHLNQWKSLHVFIIHKAPNEGLYMYNVNVLVWSAENYQNNKPFKYLYIKGDTVI